MSDAGRGRLIEHLVAARIAGPVATPRENNLRNIGLLCERQPGWTFGLEFGRPWTPEEVLAEMAGRAGVSPDPAYRTGPDTIDPERTVDQLQALAELVGRAGAQRQRVLLATGHPAGLLGCYARIGAALAGAGAALLTPGAGARYRTGRGEEREIRWLLGVAAVSSGGGLNHTHSPVPMRILLAALESAGEPPPDLVIADHGWAGAAGQAGIRCAGFADCNDPALFIGQAEGKVEVCVPLDDNVLPHLYEPLADFVLTESRLAQVPR